MKEKNQPKTVLLLNKRGKDFTYTQIEAIELQRKAGGMIAVRERNTEKLMAIEHIEIKKPEFIIT